MKEDEIRPRQLFNRYLQLSQKDIENFFSDQTHFVEVPCPACNSKKITEAFTKNQFKYKLCSECESLFLSPRPSQEMYADFYRHSDSVRFWSTDFYKQTAEARRLKIYRPRAERIVRWMRQSNISSEKNKRFVDIGCGYGIFLEEMKRVDFFNQIMGIEPVNELAGICQKRGFQVFETYLETVENGLLKADFATAFEVLEHVCDPQTFLAAAHRVLNTNGFLMLTTLTVSGFDIQILWEKSNSVHPPHHINLLSVEGIRRLVERCHLRLVDLRTPGELDIDIVRNAQREDPGIKIPRFINAIINSSEEVRARFQNFLKENLLSSHLQVILARESAAVNNR
ncbi:MAG: class I SAM-dependent methyltransferase [Desulfobacterales bacterium]|jgi:2-polyprenyl-3-methyl-5-hydroxy-6-metoxy-1,4-benzoquinol methylase